MWSNGYLLALSENIKQGYELTNTLAYYKLETKSL